MEDFTVITYNYDITACMGGGEGGGGGGKFRNKIHLSAYGTKLIQRHSFFNLSRQMSLPKLITRYRRVKASTCAVDLCEGLKLGR